MKKTTTRTSRLTSHSCANFSLGSAAQINLRPPSSLAVGLPLPGAQCPRDFRPQSAQILIANHAQAQRPSAMAPRCLQGKQKKSRCEMVEAKRNAFAMRFVLYAKMQLAFAAKFRRWAALAVRKNFFCPDVNKRLVRSAI